MKRIESENTWLKQLKVLIVKRPFAAMGITAAAVFLISMTLFLSLMKESKEIVNTVEQSELTAPSASTSTTTMSLSTLDEQITAIKEIARTCNGGGKRLDNYNTSQKIYDTEREPDDKAFVQILDKLRLNPTDEIDMPSVALCVEFGVERGKESVAIYFYRETDSSPTYVKMVFGKGKVFYYQGDSSVYDTARENLAKQTIHASKAAADKFLIAFEKKDVAALKQMIKDPTELDKWPLLQPGGGTISNLQAEPITVEDTDAIFKITFRITNGDPEPFLEKDNEYLLEISKPDSSDSFKADIKKLTDG